MSIKTNIKKVIRKYFPIYFSTLNWLKSLKFQGKSMDTIFNEIYQQNFWGSQESVSGTGSDSVQTALLTQEIPIIIQEIDAKTILDAPCGDFHWMKNVVLNMNLEKYIGVDIVANLVKQNQANYGNENINFMVLDISQESLPKTDLVFCRDCLVHFSFQEILKTIENIKNSQSKYLLTTTFTQTSKNKDIITGSWRPINLELAPFNFPKPIKVINEGCTSGDGFSADKSLALWKIADI